MVATNPLLAMTGNSSVYSSMSIFRFFTEFVVLYQKNNNSGGRMSDTRLATEKTVVVTGCAGFIGWKVAEKLL